jgi:hypothetical protein
LIIWYSLVAAVVGKDNQFLVLVVKVAVLVDIEQVLDFQ